MTADTDKPRGERRTASELRQVLIGTDVLGLHDVLGLRVVARDGACCPVEALVVAADEDFKEGSLAGQNACDYLFVADGGGYGLRGGGDSRVSGWRDAFRKLERSRDVSTQYERGVRGWGVGWVLICG